MFWISAKKAMLLSGFLIVCVTRAAAGDGGEAAHVFCHDWFGKEALSTPITLSDTNIVVSAVTLDGQPSGWIFRTCQVPPSCKGKRGPIDVLVAIGTDARIKGLTVLAHKEDPPYFRRLKDSFFSQFLDQRAGDDAVKIDAVTRATFSSRAIIRDVMEGAKNVLSQPEVAAQLKSPNKGG